MTSASASQSIRPGRTDDVPDSLDERAILTRFLDYARDTVHAKCAGLSEADARRAPLPGSPLMTISGLVSHLRWVECSWIDKTLLGGTHRCPVDRRGSRPGVPDRGRDPARAVAGGVPGRLRPAPPSWWPPWTWTPRPGANSAGGPSRSRSAGSCSTWSKRPLGTTVTSTFSASSPTARAEVARSIISLPPCHRQDNSKKRRSADAPKRRCAERRQRDPQAPSAAHR